MEDGDFWNGMIEDLMPRLKKIWQINKNLL
jgi:hypothetical protein